MKNRISIITILIFATVICLIGYYFLNSKSNETESFTPAAKKLSDGKGIVEIVNNRGVKKVVVNDITIKNVSIFTDNKKRLYFELTSKTTNLNNLTLNVILLNSGEEASANQKKIRLSGAATDLEKEKFSKLLVLDIESIYNDPKQIKFNFEQKN